MKKTIIIGIVLLTGCSANRVQLEPQAINNQTVSYVRGSSKLNSQSLLKPELAIIEHSSDEMVIALSVTNTTMGPILFSENNLVANRLSADKLQPATIYRHKELVEEASEKGYQTAAKVGNTAASVGASFIPFGGIALSIGRLFYSIGSSNTESYEDRIDKITFSQLDKNYIRQHTIESTEKYSGILKIGFDDDLKPGDNVIFSLSAEGNVEKFVFKCRQVKN